MKHLLRVCLTLSAVAAFATASRAQNQDFTAILTGPGESPPNASPGFGFADVTINPLLNTMRVQVTFSGLLGTTTASHIHAATAVPGTGTAGVATTTPTFTGFPSGVTSGSYDNTFDMTLASSYNPTYVAAHGGTTAGAESALFSALTLGESYLNIHTTVVPGGEIRGFLAPVATAPEPGSLGLLAGICAPAALMLLRRKRR